MNKEYKGIFIHSTSLNEIEIINATCTVDQDGTIISFEPCSKRETLFTEGKDCKSRHDIEQGINENENENEDKNEDCFWVPGFIDCHTHAPQYENLGLGLDKELLEWLQNTTIPTEMTFKCDYPSSNSFHSKHDLVQSKYDSMIKRYLKMGTTTACYFGSIHLESNKILVNLLQDIGQRAFVGKTCMNQHSFHDYLDESIESSLDDTGKFIEFCREKNENNNAMSMMITPVITPRFAISCSMELMKGLAQLARDHDCFIQSHLSENKKEIEFIKLIYPDHENYTQVYDEAGLLTKKTIMAHCIHLNDNEIETLKDRKVSIAHCPISNFSLNSGIMNTRKLLNSNIKIGLGSDISGGYSICMLEVMRQAIIASKVIYFNDDQYLPLSCKEAFYLATLGGAMALGIDHMTGNFKIGKKFDALCIKRDKLFPLDNRSNLMQEFERFIYCGDDRRISKIFVNGKQVIS